MCLKYFLKKYEELRVFRLILDYSLIHNELLGNISDNITWKLSEKIKIKGAIIWIHHLSMKIDGGGQIGIAMKNIDTRNISSVAKNAKKRENVLDM